MNSTQQGWKHRLAAAAAFALLAASATAQAQDTRL
jgi:hypothetical protein